MQKHKMDYHVIILNQTGINSIWAQPNFWSLMVLYTLYKLYYKLSSNSRLSIPQFYGYKEVKSTLPN